MKSSLGANGPKTKEMALNTLKTLFRQLSLADEVNFSSTRKAVNEVLKGVLRDKGIMQSLTKVRSFDSYAFDHSINVCALSLLIGLYRKLTTEELYELGTGALLHDIGMNKLEKQVLYKTSALTIDELEHVKRHTFLGYEILLNIAGLSEEAAIVAWQHHERLDGSGYPRGLAGDNVHEFSTIVAVADVFDALISDRPFRNAFYPHQAVDILVHSKGKFSEDVVKVFVEKVIIYPMGTRVMLNTGDIGIVVDTNKDHTRPVIRLETKENQWLTAYKEMDLSKHRDTFIVRVMKDK